MLNRVDLYLVWQFQLVGPGGDNLDNLIGFYSTVVQLAARAAGYNVLGIEPYMIPFLERWCRSSSSVGTFTITVLGLKDFCLKVFLDLF